MDVHARIVPTEVVVIGAGAAGLAAARTLRRRGVETLLVEARDRVGGRAYTLRTPDGAYPLELGAEFVHGTAQAMAALLDESGARTMEISSVPGIWEATERVLDLVDVTGADRSVDAFLKSVKIEGTREARMLIEGFDAAITRDASTIGIAREWRSGANDSQSRLVDGYSSLMQYLTSTIADALLLQTRVERVAWSPRDVRVEALRFGEPLEIRARRAIITVPVGVLRDLHFAPPLPAEKRRALSAIALGPVIKVILHFRSVFWEDGFFQPAEGYGFTTVWSRMPQRAPVLAAWAGGDAVNRLYETAPQPIAAALDACQTLFPEVDVREQLQAAYWHDWQADPYARGAYSYLRVNAGNAREVLGRPVGDTLFFAGEATSEIYSGTVSGAVESGERAAREAASAPS